MIKEVRKDIERDNTQTDSLKASSEVHCTRPVFHLSSAERFAKDMLQSMKPSSIEATVVNSITDVKTKFAEHTRMMRASIY